MSEWGISNAISKGIENGMSKISDNINEFFRNLIFDCLDILLDAGATIIIILILWICFKFMYLTDSNKREQNANVMVCLLGIYFIIRVLARILS